MSSNTQMLEFIEDGNPEPKQEINNDYDDIAHDIMAKTQIDDINKENKEKTTAYIYKLKYLKAKKQYYYKS